MTYRTYLLLGVTALLGSACETTLDVDLPTHPPQITVNSFFRPEALWEIHLSEARSVADGAIASRLIPNATAEILEEGRVITRLLYAGEGLYRSFSVGPAPGQTYTLHVSAPGYERIEAIDTVPELLPVSFDYEVTYRDEFLAEEAVQNAVYAEFDLTIQLTDPVDRDNYYRLNAVYHYEEGDSLLYFSRLHFKTDDETIIAENGDPFEIEENNEFADVVFSDDLFEEERHEINMTLITPVTFERPNADRIFTRYRGGTLTVFVYSLSKAYYDYAATYRLYNDVGDNPFAQPVQVHTNVQNGFGIFAGFNLYRMEVDVLGRP